MLWLPVINSARTRRACVATCICNSVRSYDGLSEVICNECNSLLTAAYRLLTNPCNKIIVFRCDAIGRFGDHSNNENCYARYVNENVRLC